VEDTWIWLEEEKQYPRTG